ncbi:MAG: efflux transporter periplasmic adaptor subunit, partial [Variovorax sp.]|nr:efflux transporter periplasmic adaptor subunit [Variovorax sp.]
MKRSVKWLLAGLVLALLVLGAWRVSSVRKAQPIAPSDATPASTVVTLGPADVVRAAVRELVQTVPVSGTLRAVDTAVLKARVAGEISGLAVREGDPVAAGQVIARIDPAEYRSRVRQAQAQADSARAQADVTQRAYDNNKALVEQAFISRSALDTSQSNLNAALSTWHAAQAAVEVARKSLDDTVLRSPIAGQVAQRLVQPGERVGIDTRLIEVVDLSRIEVEATLAAADSVAVRPGQRATLEIEGGTTGPGAGAAGRQVGASVA